MTPWRGWLEFERAPKTKSVVLTKDVRNAWMMEDVDGVMRTSSA